MEFRLLCDPESLDMSRSGAIWGDVWIEAESDPFPEFGWNDMLVAFASDVAEALVSLKQGVQCGRIRFYDGPFWITVSSSAPGTVVVTRGEGEEEKGEAAFPADMVVRSVRSAASDLIDACRAREWQESPDVVRLARVLELLR